MLRIGYGHGSDARVIVGDLALAIGGRKNET